MLLAMSYVMSGPWLCIPSFASAHIAESSLALVAFQKVPQLAIVSPCLPAGDRWCDNVETKIIPMENRKIKSVNVARSIKIINFQ